MDSRNAPGPRPSRHDQHWDITPLGKTLTCLKGADAGQGFFSLRFIKIDLSASTFRIDVIYYSGD